MEHGARIEAALEAVLAEACDGVGPQGLAQAMRYAVFPGGARIRPRLCLAVAAACGEDTPALTDAAAVCLELLHCASLVHDDLPAFDDADERRGKATVHRVFGEPRALLAGDGLIVLAFDALAAAGAQRPERLVPLIRLVHAVTGMPGGIVAGQAWESEPHVDLKQYHRAKTAALFVGATGCGALAAGDDAARWRPLGDRLGEAYQVADDLQDVFGQPEALGKPVRCDERNGRPNAVLELGAEAATARLKGLLADAVAAVPSCPGEDALRKHIATQAQAFLPKGVRLAA